MLMKQRRAATRRIEMISNGCTGNILQIKKNNTPNQAKLNEVKEKGMLHILTRDFTCRYIAVCLLTKLLIDLTPLTFASRSKCEEERERQ